MTQITLATLDSEIERCFPVLKELRSHLEASQFVSQIRRQEQQGYQLAYLEDENQIKAVAGFRIVENLAAGRFLYIDDLVTRETARSQGYGDRLFSWLVDYGHAHACCQLRLDSGVQRSQAHRFYFRQRMSIVGFHFSLEL